jgi:CRP-like cAMP-binding protein
MTATLGEEHAELLSGVELFRGVDRVTLAKLAAHLEPVAVEHGQVLIRQGDPGDGFYLVSRGTFGVFAARDAADGEVRLGTCGRGDAIGEMALLSGEARSATIRAEQDGEVLRLDQARFLSLVRADPSVALAISAGLIRRLRSADAARLGLAEPELQIVSKSAREVTRRPRLDRKTVALVLSAVIFVVGWLVPPPADLGLPGWRALVSLLAVVPILAVEALSDGAAALLLVTIWVVGGVVPARVAIGGFGNTTWILSVAVFGVGAAVAASGLLYRFSLWAVARAGGFRGQVATLGISGLFLGAAVPNATGRMSLVASGIAELAEAVGYAPRSRAAAGLAMAAMAGFGQMAAPFLTSSSTSLLAFALLPEASRANLNWVTWAMRALPMHFLVLGGMLLFIAWRYAPTGPVRAARAALSVQQTLLGSPTRHERSAGIVTLALLAGFATQPWHGIDPAWVAATAFVVLAASGVLTADVLRLVNWSTLLLLGVLTGMGDVFAAARLDTWVAGLVVGTVGGLASVPIVFIGVLGVLCIALSVVLRWQANVPLVIIALVPIAQGAGIDPWVVAIVALTAGNMFFLPFQSSIYLALYSGTGAQLFQHAQARPVAVVYAVLTILGLMLSVPLWQAMGLI